MAATERLRSMTTALENRQPRKCRTVLALLVALAILTGACGSDTTTVQTRTSGSYQEPGQNIGEGNREADEILDPLGIRREAEHYAIDYEVTTEEALRRFSRADELKVLLREIAAAESGRVAGTSLIHEPEFGGWVNLVGDAEPTALTKELAARHDDLFIELGATHTLVELETARENKVDLEAIPLAMRDRIAYTEVDVRSNSIVIAIDRDEPPVPIDETVPASEWPIESMELQSAAEALEALLEDTTGLPFSVVLGARSVTGEMERDPNDTIPVRGMPSFATLTGQIDRN